MPKIQTAFLCPSSYATLRRSGTTILGINFCCIWGPVYRQPLFQKTRGWLSEIRCWKSFSGKFRRCWKILHRFSGGTKFPVPAKVWAFSGKANGCWKMGPRLRECSWIFSSETTTAFLSFSDFSKPQIFLL